MNKPLNNILTVSKLDNERVNCCPHCREVILRTQSTGWSRSPQNKIVFDDGDCIGDVWYKLKDEQKTPNAFFYSNNVGSCFSCGEFYFAIEFNFIDHHDQSGDVIERTDVGAYLLLNIEMDEPHNYLISQSLYADIPSDWVMSVFNTPYGNMYHHTIGLIDDQKIDYKADMFLKLIDSLKLIKIDNRLD
ncbi:TPA: hypothetical protein PXM39_003603 [Yersinia enterocolitica]|nr:hypothetical protein [Yersinia enterocolitica]HDL6900996.1 hypothetical protein [Yersinia enterocolitica]HDL7092102.1 hypothetical protein [Yersinia enterocolitica]HDL7101140.1 hypothetical protein [Yersinia enterocolitica]HDL7135622.1 hypothetical protein [Yersinia enterocolitica]